MSTFTAAATQLKFVKSGSSSSWDSSGAMQGRYSGQDPRVGAILFPTLLNIDWSNQIISKITLKLTYASAGRSASKTIGLYRGTARAITGTGASMRGAGIGNAGSNGAAYNGSSTITFSAESNAPAFNNLVAYLQSKTYNTLITYMNESASGEYSENYLKITAASISITYEIAGSGGTLDKSSVDAGSAIKLTITPLENVDAALTHKATWTFGSNTQTVTLAAGVTESSFTLPLAWLNAIPSAASGAASCKLTTLVSGAERGSRTLSFTVTAPDSSAPTFTATIAPVNAKFSSASYYQYISAAKITASSAAAQYGASVVSYAISGGEASSSTASSLTTAVFQSSGVKTYTVKVTDSRGKTRTQTVACTVKAVAKPTVTEFSVDRYSTVQGDTTEYVQTDYGPNVWITAKIAFDRVDGLNVGSAWIEWCKQGASARARVNLTVSNYAVSVSKSRTILTASIPASGAYEFYLYCQDYAGASGGFASVAEGRCNLHLAGSGYGVGVGLFSEGTESRPSFDCAYPAHFYAGILDASGSRLDRAEWKPLALESGVTAGLYNSGENPPQYMVQGDHVYIRGTVVYPTAIGAALTKVATVPDAALRPKAAVIRLNCATGARRCRVEAQADGSVHVGYCYDQSGTANTSATAWYDITMDYWLG